jgi:hypothetical protein|tara:strand:+ start:407 stop:622 length:216 start_codon:yes stop_codon:yes gene_type:complete
MGCKSCNKNNGGLVDGLLGSPKERMNNMKSSLWDDTVGNYSIFEQVILILFVLIPLGVGYYVVIKFLISLF